jgi:hypothetical protein
MAVVSTWIQLPPVPVIVARSEPYLVEDRRLAEFRSHVLSAGASVVETDISNASNTAEVVGALKVILPFPDWCGSSWDSIDDAFEEIRRAWSFPLALIAHGLRFLIDKYPHLAMEIVIRMSGLAQAFSAAGDQLLAGICR